MKKILFVDRDGTIIVEPPSDYQVDAYEKLAFLPGAISALAGLASSGEYELVMVTNQDGLGTESFPSHLFQGPHDLMNQVLASEGVLWKEEIVDHTFSRDGADTRKPNIGRMQHYLQGDFDLANSFVIGDRLTDMIFAKNLGCKGILLGKSSDTSEDHLAKDYQLESTVALQCESWPEITRYLRALHRRIEVHRTTKETRIEVGLDLEGNGNCTVSTGLNFFDHMLEQIGKHGGVDLTVKAHGDLHIDEHHTIEDTALALGEAFRQALGTKRGIERYGFALPMDEASAQVLLDFGGRPWLVWDVVSFSREYVGDMPTEMVMHFFKSFSDAAQCNLNVSCEGDNEHHKIEVIFKAFARALRRAIKRDMDNFDLPSTKGTL